MTNLGYDLKAKYPIQDRSIAECVKDILAAPADFGIPDDISLADQHSAAILLADRMRRNPGMEIVDKISEEIGDRKGIKQLRDEHPNLSFDQVVSLHFSRRNQ